LRILFHYFKNKKYRENAERGKQKVNIQGGHSNFERYVPIKKKLYSHDLEKLNFKMTARSLPVIPPKCKGIPITQPEKII
jgi:hypothetical protein